MKNILQISANGFNLIRKSTQRALNRLGTVLAVSYCVKEVRLTSLGCLI